MNEVREPNGIDSFTGRYRFLSNFWLSPVVLHDDGLAYPSVEHAFQAAKTIDRARRITIREASSPGRAKQLGRHVPLRSDWLDVRCEIMQSLVVSKFSYGELRDALLATGDAQLTECNTWHDQLWGDCRCGWRELCAEPGENLLGKYLVEVRSRI